MVAIEIERYLPLLVPLSLPLFVFVSVPAPVSVSTNLCLALPFLVRRESVPTHARPILSCHTGLTCMRLINAGADTALAGVAVSGLPNPHRLRTTQHKGAGAGR